MATRARWDQLDWLLLTVLAVVAAVARGVGLGTPKDLVFDEFYYVPDACRMANLDLEFCVPGELTWMHPPLGKWFIALGMQTLGPTRFGWRLMPLLAGVITVGLLYCLGRRILKGRVGAVLAGGLLCFDFMHFVHSRLAILDVFAAMFGTAAVLFIVIDRDADRRGRGWRWAAGLACGAAVASKWSGGLVLVAVIVLALIWDRGSEWPLRRSLVSIAASFVFLPLVVYTVSYAGFFDGSSFAAPWADGSWGYRFVERQAEMFHYHTSVRANLQFLPHPSASPAWSWLLLRRPMAYYFDAHGDLYREILAMGHPLMWPLGIPALLWAAARAVRGSLAGTVVTVVFGCAYLPWLVLTWGGQDPYPFYLLPGIPFLYLGLGAAAGRLWSSPVGRAAVSGVAVAAVAVFAFYYPLLTARPLTVPQWRSRIPFHDCERFDNPALERLEGYVSPGLSLEGLERAPRPSDRLYPIGTKATGWCWI